MPDYAFSIFSLIGVILCFEPLYFNWREKQRGSWSSLLLFGWISVYNVLSFVDSIIWSGDDVVGWFDGIGYCDIVSRIKMSFPFGILGSTIGTCMFLLTAIGNSRGNITAGRKRRMRLVDCGLGVGLPLVFCALHFVIEPFRYQIMGVTGCQSSFDNSWPTLLLSTIWPPILSIISLILTGMVLRRWWMRRADLNEEWTLVVPPVISKEHFQRLFITAAFIGVIYFPFSLYILGHLVSVATFEDFSWDKVHGDGWNIAVKLAQPIAPAPAWIGIILAAVSMLLLTTATTTKKRCTSCLVWLDNHLTSGGSQQNLDEIQNPHPSDQKIPHRSSSMLNHFRMESDEDTLDDEKSLPPSERTLPFRDEDDMLRHPQVELEDPFRPHGTTTEISAGLEKVSWDHGVTVTREVVVTETGD